jgi:hypothetical protein
MQFLIGVLVFFVFFGLLWFGFALTGRTGHSCHSGQCHCKPDRSE